MNKPNSNRYISFPVGIIYLFPFNLLMLFVAPFILSSIFESWSNTWLTVGSVLILSNLLLIGSNYSAVKGNQNKITLSSLTKSITLDNITEIKAWWCYDLSGSKSYQYKDIGPKMKQSASKLNCIVKFSSKSESIYILEEIHLSDKFPNHIPYAHDEPVDESRRLVVWDVDNCLEALGIKLK